MGSQPARPIQLPGFGLPLNHRPQTSTFPNALDEEDIDCDDVGPGFMPDASQVSDREITARWRREVFELRQDVTTNMMNWIIQEMQWKAGVLHEQGLLSVFDVGVVRSDTAVSPAVQQRLREAVVLLEQSPWGKDYHPGSDEKVVNLVHPSLFPVVYGRTRILPAGVLADVGNAEDAPHTAADSSGCPAMWRCPRREAAAILDATIPLWDSSLAPIRQWPHGRIRYAEWERSRPIELPEPGAFSPPPRAWWRGSVHLRDGFRQQGLQVTVKLANIELSPARPDYGGGSWHPERQMNERICATAIYYYDSHNITVSRLAFRQRASMPEGVYYPQDQPEFLQAVYGFGPEVQGYNDSPITQDLGSVLCADGRLVTFPHTVQHRVLPFSLADRSHPGHRKILALFLIDPHRPIISSANAPPQQEDRARERREVVCRLFSERLSAELQDIVSENMTDGAMTMEKTKAYRLELIAERSIKQKRQNEIFEIGSFSLCEH
ncbi:hypothetical protein BO70DRAFT_432546 [Aspergillus heteromorphus CBS 117.55]|uniref:DUF4246 domain-containing protein n=1 Tax=Aspergillus heteromorphus CBS 117.55 TaxID=1448321 RepID=A0A317V7M7_9EURO|nr:uncharacterized protein BO70DRAFT_432546 [Aspergillus heteromorphus CBS 117.55]PWY69048.1 hypothetical protein BO70DRAFT_432546 [Aspergillus heteromorphus CBS 117.55]